jgi:hypothetical protein
LTWKIDGREFECKPVEMLERQDQTLIRLGGSSQMKTTKNASETTALALKYQLLSENSNLFLVHVRSAEEKATSLPALQQIAQMQAAGQNGYGTLTHAIIKPLQILRTGSDNLSFAVPASQSSPAVWRGTRTSAAQKADSLTSGGMNDYEIPAFLRSDANPHGTPKLNSPISKKDLHLIGGMDGNERHAFSRKTDDSPPKKVVQEPVRLSLPPRGSDILRRFNTLAWKETNFSVIIESLSDLIADSSTERLLGELIAAGNTREIVWAVYLDWLIKEANGMFAMDRHAVRLLRHEMSKVSDQQKGVFGGSFLSGCR